MIVAHPLILDRDDHASRAAREENAMSSRRAHHDEPRADRCLRGAVETGDWIAAERAGRVAGLVMLARALRRLAFWMRGGAAAGPTRPSVTRRRRPVL
jgi:hypothetical protein